MAEAAIIAWTPANMITVVLMVAIMFVLISTAARIWQQRQQTQAAAA